MAIIAQEAVHCQKPKCLTQDHTEIYVLVQSRALETCDTTNPCQASLFSKSDNIGGVKILMLTDNSK